MAEAVYLLCALTSVCCAALLWRSYSRTHTSLLLWSFLCFTGLAANNILLFVDLVMVPAIDLSVLRGVLALLGMMALIFGLVWESREA
jgi:hypothetical protein